VTISKPVLPATVSVRLVPARALLRFDRRHSRVLARHSSVDPSRSLMHDVVFVPIECFRSRLARFFPSIECFLPMRELFRRLGSQKRCVAERADQLSAPTRIRLAPTSVGRLARTASDGLHRPGEALPARTSGKWITRSLTSSRSSRTYSSCRCGS
jgi:hypothetical protein